MKITFSLEITGVHYKTSTIQTICAVTGPVTRVPHGQRMRNEWRLVIKKRMTLTKKKNNTHKQRTILPNDERPFKGSNGHATISMDAKKWHSFDIRRLMRHSCDKALSQKCHYNVAGRILAF